MASRYLLHDTHVEVLLTQFTPKCTPNTHFEKKMHTHTCTEGDAWTRRWPESPVSCCRCPTAACVCCQFSAWLTLGSFCSLSLSDHFNIQCRTYFKHCASVGVQTYPVVQTGKAVSFVLQRSAQVIRDMQCEDCSRINNINRRGFSGDILLSFFFVRLR